MQGGGDFYDSLEGRDPEARAEAQLMAVRRQIAQAKAQAPYYAEVLAVIDGEAIRTRADWAAIPVTRKSELMAIQSREPPFGGLATLAPGGFARLFLSPGPLYDAEPPGGDPWHAARALYASGFRPADIIQNCFSYHLTPAGSIFEGGARALGCAVIPAGTGNTEQQVQALAGFRPSGYAGTPDFLKIILEKADALGVDTACLKRGHVSAGPFLPDVKKFYAARGIDVYESYATAELGVIAYQSSARDGLIVDEDVLVEIVRPGTGDPVSDGEVGEVLVTTFEPAYPLIRYATGDLSAVMPGPSPCGRTNLRLKGWMGRADQTTKVKGMFVHPHQVAEVIRRHPEINRARLVVGRADGNDTMTLHCSIDAPDAANVRFAEDAGFAERVAETMQAVTKLRGTVILCRDADLPNDGKVIEDAR